MALKKFLYEVFSLFSRTLHVLAGGDADLTLSARSHYSSWWTEKWIDAGFRLVLKEHNHCRNAWELEKTRSLKRIINSIFFLQKDHCKSAYDYDLKLARQLIQAHEVRDDIQTKST